MPAPKSLEEKAQAIAQQEHTNATLLEEALLRVLAYGFRGGNNQERVSQVVSTLSAELDLVNELHRFSNDVGEKARPGNVPRQLRLERSYLHGVD